jgi:hypothetical protein
MLNYQRVMEYFMGYDINVAKNSDIPFWTSVRINI